MCSVVLHVLAARCTKYDVVAAVVCTYRHEQIDAHWRQVYIRCICVSRNKQISLALACEGFCSSGLYLSAANYKGNGDSTTSLSALSVENPSVCTAYYRCLLVSICVWQPPYLQSNRAAGKEGCMHGETEHLLTFRYTRTYM